MRSVDPSQLVDVSFSDPADAGWVEEGATLEPRTKDAREVGVDETLNGGTVAGIEMVVSFE